jgi:hypothetical protein
MTIVRGEKPLACNCLVCFTMPGLEAAMSGGSVLKGFDWHIVSGGASFIILNGGVLEQNEVTLFQQRVQLT